ncbi:hypothetical protein EUX98_g8145, partial [Antrodiella citrinella]
DPSMTYFSVGQDEPMSIIDDWGPDDKDPLKIDTLPLSRLSHLAFLFGGVGDARHVFGSIIGLHRAYRGLSKAKKTRIQAHMTLLDIHPTALARDLCMIMLIDQLVTGGLDKEATA